MLLYPETRSSPDSDSFGGLSSPRSLKALHCPLQWLSFLADDLQRPGGPSESSASRQSAQRLESALADAAPRLPFCQRRNKCSAIRSHYSATLLSQRTAADTETRIHRIRRNACPISCDACRAAPFPRVLPHDRCSASVNGDCAEHACPASDAPPVM